MQRREKAEKDAEEKEEKEANGESSADADANPKESTKVVAKGGKAKE